MLSTRRIMTKFMVVIPLLLMTIPTTKGADISPSAQTQQGIYIGRQTTIHGTNVNYWLGILYAQAPIGNLRWMPPQALAISNVTREAYNSVSCHQLYDMGFPRTEVCLIVNVYAPENANNLPVYVWIHGDAFYAGASLQYDGTPFVSTSIINSVPVIVVTINYRLGLLGFMADKELFEERSGIDNRKTTGNYGILDQIMALDWIKKNIAGFGGNPEQITVGGESAGGISTVILLATSLVPSGTFQRAAVESGTLWPNQAYPLQTAINKTGNVLRASTHCTTLQCLRNLTADQIHAVESILLVTENGATGIPVIDGYALDYIIENYYANGNFKKMPLLIGSTANETTFITCSLLNGSATSAQVQEYFRALYNTTIVDEIPAIYGPISAMPNPLIYLNIVFTNAWMNCGSRRITSSFSSYGIPSYLFTYNHLLSTTSSCAGATHSSDLPMLFPSYLPYFSGGYTFDAIDQQVSTSMMLYWAHFISSSNPNYNGSPANWDACQQSVDNDFVIQFNPYMRNRHYYPTCTGLWDRYAVTNKTITSAANTYTNKYSYFLLLFFCFLYLHSNVSIGDIK